MFTINQNLIDDFADKINEKEKKNNKVSSWSDTTTDIHYPSEKLVKDSLDNVLKNFRTKTITSTFPMTQTQEYEDNGVTHTSTMYDGGGGGHWELTINLTSLNNGRLALVTPEYKGAMEIIVNDGTLAIADLNGNIYLDGDTLPNIRESTATGTSGSDMPVTIPYENVIINFKNNGEDILITFSQTNTTIYSMTLHQNENWEYDVVSVMTLDNPNYTITGVSKYDIPNYYTETNYTFTNPEKYGDNDVEVPIYDFSIVEYTVDFTYDDIDSNNDEMSLLGFGGWDDFLQIYVLDNKIYWVNQNLPDGIQSDEEFIDWVGLNCPMLCEGTQITFKRYFIDGYVITEWNDSNIIAKSDNWYYAMTNWNEPILDYFDYYEGIDSVNVTVLRFKKALPTLVSDLEDANQYEKVSNKSSSISTDTGSTTKYPTVKAIEDYVEDSITEIENSVAEIEKPKFKWKDFFDSDNWFENYDTYKPTYNGNNELICSNECVYIFPQNRSFPSNYSMSFTISSTDGKAVYFQVNSTYVLQNLTGSYDVSIVCEDNEVTVTTSPTTSTYTFNNPLSSFRFFFRGSAKIINFTYSESSVSTLTVYEENALTNLGTSANATQSTINSAINSLIGQGSSGGSGGSGGSCVSDFYIDTTTDEWVIETSVCSGGEVVASWSSTLTDTKVPSEKLVKQYVDNLVGSAIQYIIGSGS